MGRTTDLLEEQRLAGAEAAELARLAVRLLGDPSATAPELAEPEMVIGEARVAFARLEAECRAAFAKYPAVRGANFHSGDADPRSFTIYSTMAEVQKAGMYTASELSERLAAGTVTEAWAAAESLRLGAFLVVLKALIQEVDRRKLDLPRYREGIADAAREVGAVTVASA